jgi:hypothetical protein
MSFLTDKEIKTIRTSQLKGELRSCIRLSNKILDELIERGED